MRMILVVVLVVVAASVASAFYLGLLSMSAERVDKTYLVHLVVHPDFMVPEAIKDSSADGSESLLLEARGTVAGVNVETNQFTLTENFRNMTFRVNNDTVISINGQAAKLAQMQGGDEATVSYSKQGQMLHANVVRCTRK